MIQMNCSWLWIDASLTFWLSLAFSLSLCVSFLHRMNQIFQSRSLFQYPLHHCYCYSNLNLNCKYEKYNNKGAIPSQQCPYYRLFFDDFSLFRFGFFLSTFFGFKCRCRFLSTNSFWRSSVNGVKYSESLLVLLTSKSISLFGSTLNNLIFQLNCQEFSRGHSPWGNSYIETLNVRRIHIFCKQSEQFLY